MAGKTSRRRVRQRNRSGMAVIGCVVLILCVVLMYNSVKLNDKLEGYRTTVEELQEQIDEQNEVKAVLENKEAYMNSDEYYKELAQEKLGLAGSEDILFKKSDE